MPSTPGVTVPAGMKTAPFTVTTAGVGKNTKATISASANDIDAMKTLTVTPAP